MRPIQAFREALPDGGGGSDTYSDKELHKALVAAFATMYPVREPVGIAVDRADAPVIVCSDGSSWVFGRSRSWIEIPPIPGSAADGGLGTGPARSQPLSAPERARLTQILRDALSQLPEPLDCLEAIVDRLYDEIVGRGS